jgi:hypothetical protein
MLEGHPLSAIRYCLFSIFVATLHIWSSSHPTVTWGRAMPWWQWESHNIESESKFRYFFRWMEMSGDKKSRRICLVIGPLFFHIFPELVQALVITYSEIFQALAVEGDVLLPKSFLDLGHHRTAPTRTPRSFTCLVNWKKHPRAAISNWRHRQSEVQKWLRDQYVFFYRQGLENLLVRYDKCLYKFGDYVKK